MHSLRLAEPVLFSMYSQAQELQLFTATARIPSPAISSTLSGLAFLLNRLAHFAVFDSLVAASSILPPTYFTCDLSISSFRHLTLTLSEQSSIDAP